ncbi:MAG: hypothetical protein ACUVTO_08840 [Candidatus Caldatribacteriaceae bacterium]
MEEERKHRNLADFLRKNAAQVDHWFVGEESFVHHEIRGEESLAPAEFWERGEWGEFPENPEGAPDFPRVFFVDGRMRVHVRLLVRTAVLLLAEVAAGYAVWERGRGLSFGFSPSSPPSLERVVGAKESSALRTQVEQPEIDLGMGLVFRIEESQRYSRSLPGVEVAHQAVFNAMQRLERQEVARLLNQGAPVVKDGTIHFVEPRKFHPGIGPCGLVKGVEELRLPQGWLDHLFRLERGKRTPFVSSFLEREEADTLRVFSYVRLVEQSPLFPWKGLVRLEAIVPKERFSEFRGEISRLFDGLARVLPLLSGDYPWRRLPENIFPIIALEERLAQHFASSSLVRELTQRLLFWGRRERGGV